MKKFLAILMAICMVATALGVPAFAAEARAAGTVLRVSIVQNNGSTIVGDYADFEEGWNYAMETADAENMAEKGYSRIVVDIYADWKADGGKFGSGDGFSSGAIKFPENVRATLNLNGHTIDRDLSDWKWNGEVIYVDEKANVIINNGTITGGWSGGGAGGIHIDDGARVELNNVTIKDNISDDDDGGGIAVYDGATLTMNGGSFVDNEINGKETEGSYSDYYGGAVYVEDSTATFNGVTFKNNYTEQYDCFGAAIYAADSNITINGCTFDGNGHKGKTKASMSTIHANDSSIRVKGSTFVGNGDKCDSQTGGGYSAVFMLNDSTLTMEKGETNNRFIGNTAHFLFNDVDDSTIFISDTDFVDNASAVLYGDDDSSAQSYFKNCTFKNNKNDKFVSFYDVNTPLTFTDCDMGDSTFDEYCKTIRFVVSETQGLGETPAAGTAIRVSAIKEDGSVVALRDIKTHAEGWRFAMSNATDSTYLSKNGYTYIVIELYADWKADTDGVFGSGTGFKNDTLYIPMNAKVVINMNGHTIDRGLGTKNEDDGEVLCIDENADVIINGGKLGDAIAMGDDDKATFGTITGGNSDNGAGGIHIYDNAKVTLNNVKIAGNITDDDDGAGIALYDGATIIMNGGGFINNKNNTYSNSHLGVTPGYGAGIYVEDSTASFNKVLFKNNQFTYDSGLGPIGKGAALYAKNSSITMDGCKVVDNGIENKGIGYKGSNSVIEMDCGSLTVKNTTFTGNGFVKDFDGGDYSCLFYTNAASVSLDTCTFTGNTVMYIFCGGDYDMTANNSRFVDNGANILDNNDRISVTFTDSEFSNNRGISEEGHHTFNLVDSGKQIDFINCALGNSTFNDSNRVKIVSNATGSILGEGSLSMIFALLSLVASGVAVFLVVYYNKKKAVPAIANNAAETTDEE